MTIYEITQDHLVSQQPPAFSRHGLREHRGPQRPVRDQAAIIGPEVSVLREEFGGGEDSQRRNGVHSIRHDADVVITEWTHTEDGGHMERPAPGDATMVLDTP